MEYYYYDAGAVHVSAAPVQVKNSVVDWDKLQINYKRHMTYHGVMRSYSPESVRFVKNGAAILRHVFNNLGDIEAECYLEIRKLNTTDQLYYPRGICAIDFSKYNNSELYVNVGLMEGGLSAKLQAYDATDFTIPIGEPGVDPDSDYVWISGEPGVDPGGVMLLGKYNYQTQKSGSTSIDVSAGSFGATVTDQTLGTVFINQEGAYSVLTPGSPLTGNGTRYGSLFDSAWSAKAIEAFTGTLTGSVTFAGIENLISSDQSITLSIHAMIYNYGWGSPGSVGSLIADNVLWTDPFGAITPGSSSTTTSATFAPLVINFDVGDVLIITLRATTSAPETGGGVSILGVELGTDPAAITLDFQYRQPDTPCRTLSHWQVFRKLFHKIVNSSAVDPVSDLLTTDTYPGPDVFNLNPKYTFFTCGDALRQLYVSPDLTNTDPSLKINFKDFAKDGFNVNAAGVGIELDGSSNEVLRFEDLGYFYRKDILIRDLGNKISNWRMSRLTEYLGNNIKTGYSTQTYDEVNGKYEYNAENSLQTPVTRVHKEIDLKSPFRHDCYGIEYTRANLANKQTTDSESDNDTFKIQSNGNTLSIPGLSPDPYGVDKAQTVTAGLPADVWPTVYNQPFTPARNIGRLTKWLKSNFYGLLSPIIKFTKAGKNADLVSSMYTGPTVTENGDTDLTPDGTGDDIYYKPYVFEFNVQIPINLPDDMEATPTKYGVYGHTFTRGGADYYLEGFVLDIGIVDGTNDVYSVKLLCSPDTDVSGLL